MARILLFMISYLALQYSLCIIKVESHQFLGEKRGDELELNREEIEERIKEEHRRIQTNNIVTRILDSEKVEASCTSTVKRSVSAPTTTSQHSVVKHAK